MSDITSTARVDANREESRTAAQTAAVVPALALDHREAKARALSVLWTGDPSIAARDAFNALAERNRQLVNGSPAEIRVALADQVALLEATVSAYTIAAARERKIENRRALAGVALRASTTLTQVLLALHRVTEDQRNGAAINV
ncbi:hypothetical protein GPA22_09615 [Aromatoleum toluvorans]|uniref:Uncharacterized protein n=1 Tax=Aromatoleum toluvorans TaxID=92002 RepID=A0ABX1PX14_9RHOO|nr:hypothetical protein [Aromatoleum toluvorans]NMG43984.1 hypothetical protein [Aromatoleum toluvorans]